MFDWKSRFKNPLFWVTFLGLFLSVTKISPMTLTSWGALKDAVLGVFSNPYLLGCFILAIIGQINNPITSGLMDSVVKGIYGIKYKLKKDKEDLRDFLFSHNVITASSVDLRSKMPPVFDQGQLGSCTANAGVGAMMYLNPAIALSRLFMYFKERAIDGTIAEDSGASIRDECKVAANGICAEIFMPYDISKFTVPPSNDAELDAPKHKITTYKSVKGLEGIKQALTLCKPVLIGMSVFESFEGATIAKSGKMSMPKKSEKNLGGHAVLVVGYDDKKKVLIVRNSWGDTWGDKGYFYMPYAYIPNTYDYWIME